MRARRHSSNGGRTTGTMMRSSCDVVRSRGRAAELNGAVLCCLPHKLKEFDLSNDHDMD